MPHRNMDTMSDDIIKTHQSSQIHVKVNNGVTLVGLLQSGAKEGKQSGRIIVLYVMEYNIVLISFNPLIYFILDENSRYALSM